MIQMAMLDDGASGPRAEQADRTSYNDRGAHCRQREAAR
jgi:hypothetical protein